MDHIDLTPSLECRAVCPACKGEFSLNQDGTVRRHSLLGNMEFDCPGGWVMAERVVVNANVLGAMIEQIQALSANSRPEPRRRPRRLHAI